MVLLSFPLGALSRKSTPKFRYPAPNDIIRQYLLGPNLIRSDTGPSHFMNY